MGKPTSPTPLVAESSHVPAHPKSSLLTNGSGFPGSVNPLEVKAMEDTHLTRILTAKLLSVSEILPG